MAPSTLGTFLRSFTFGHVRQLDRVLGEVLRRAWRAGAAPGKARLVIDIDSFVGEVHGYAKQGAGYGYTGRLGYHPLLATRAGTNEVLHVRLRKGQANTQRGALRFVDELLARVRRAGARRGPHQSPLGIWNRKVTARLRAKGCRYSIGVTLHKIVTAQIAQIPDDAWQPVADYPDTGICELAETTLGEDRLIIRRVHVHAQDDQTELFTYWRHFAFITNRTEPMHVVDSEHRQDAQVELVIRDLKDQALAHFPSGALQRQRRLDRDRVPRAQPQPLDHPARPERPNTTGRRDDAPATVRTTRPPDPQRASPDDAPARPLALANRLHRSAHAHPSAPRRGSLPGFALTASV